MRSRLQSNGKSFKSLKSLLTCLVAVFAAQAAMPAGADEQAGMADQFVNSIGVCTHLFKSGTPYTNYTLLTKPLLTGLGVRHIRDEMATDNPNGNYWSNLNDLGSSGIRCNLLITPAWMSVAQALSCTTANLLNCQEAVEGPNEWDQNHSDPQGRFPDPNWMTTDNTYTQQIKSAYGGNSSTSSIAIIGTTIVTVPNTNAYVSAYGSIAPYVNYGNCHAYVFWASSPEAGLPSVIPGWAPLWGSAPFMVTETGYYTGSATNSVDPIIAGKCIPRTLFYLYNYGAYRTYLYELFDEGTDKTDSEMNFGLVDNGGQPKPAYSAVKNLIGLLSDRGAAFTTGRLAWSLSGNTANFNHTLLQKRDGSYYLVMWAAADKSVSATSQAVTLTVPSSINQATQYSLDNNGNLSSSAMTIASGRINLNLTDTVSVLKLARLPDLVVTSVSLAPTSPKSGDHVVFSCVVKNQGTAATPAGTKMLAGFYLDGSSQASTWEDTNTASLAPGASVTLTASSSPNGVNYWTATKGSHTVKAWVDDQNTIAENNDGNNTLTKSFTVN